MAFEHNLFYVPPENISKTHIVFSKGTAHHAHHVLRKKQGDTVFVTDGQGNIFKTRVIHAQGSLLKADVLERKTAPPLQPPFIDLAFVPIKGNRNEYILEKGKELGVHVFLPFISQNAVVKSLSRQKIDRFTHIMTSAMLQSQQCYISPIIPIDEIRTLIKRFDRYDQVIVAEPTGSSSVPLEGQSVLLIIGPEGGFGHDEVSMFTHAGAEPLSLGARLLRSETAAIVGLTKILTAYNLL